MSKTYVSWPADEFNTIIHDKGINHFNPNGDGLSKELLELFFTDYDLNCHTEIEWEANDKEIHKWAKENIKKGWTFVILNNPRRRFVLCKSKNDAMLFKLRWV